MDSIMSEATILLLADIHSNRIALEAVINEVNTNYDKIDHIITLGDVVGYGPHPNEVLSWVMDNADIMVLGNHDLAVGLGNADGFNKDAKAAALWNYLVLEEDSSWGVHNTQFARKKIC